MSRTFSVAFFLLALCAPECRKQEQSDSGSKWSATRATDKWIGRWNGPEGTYLELSKRGDHYSIQIKDLGKLQTYEGSAAADRISFMRNGKAEFISSGNGEETGMKWLRDKKNCLLVHPGEGYCRD
jgi:hypothetical protein